MTTTTTTITAARSISCPADPHRLSSRNSQLTGMATTSQGHFDAYEALDLTEFAKNQPWWRKLFGPETRPSGEKYSVATQLLIGGVTGWCTGFIFQKVGKLAATAVGGGFFLLQLANHTGYIKVDWKRVEKDMKRAKEQLKIRKSTQIPNEVKSKAEELVSFVKKNVLVTGGFLGGFLLASCGGGERKNHIRIPGYLVIRPSVPSGPGCAHAALHVRSRSRESTGCYLQASRRRTLEGELAEPPGSATLRALGTGLSPQLQRPRADSPQVPSNGLAANLTGGPGGRARGGAPSGHALRGRLWSRPAPSGPLHHRLRPGPRLTLPPDRWSTSGPIPHPHPRAHAQSQECFDSSGLEEGAGVARVGGAPPSVGCHYGEPGKRGRARAAPGARLARKQVSRRVGLGSVLRGYRPGPKPAAHARAGSRPHSRSGPAPG
ncbi:FUN14 domain-containing protein 2 [Sigmodon hispidus]